MGDLVVDVTELAVGLACLVVAVGAARRDLRGVAALLVLAGFAAVAHATLQLAG